MKRILLLILAAILTVSIAGCSISSSKKQNGEASGSAGINISEADYEKLLQGSDPKLVDSVDIMNKTEIRVNSEILFNLINGGMFFKSVKGYLKDGTELDNGYTSYLDGAVLCNVYSGRVRNIIFTEKYTDDVCNSLKPGNDLKEVENKLGKASVGSAEDGYLGYRTSDIYIFFYNNEISIYGYYYHYNEYFEEYVSEYLKTNDLNEFIESVQHNWIDYTVEEYDKKKNYAHLVFPARGVEIYIKDNNSKGIILYSNYYFSDDMSQLVKDGKVTLKEDEDLIVTHEKQRRALMDK